MKITVPKILILIGVVICFYAWYLLFHDEIFFGIILLATSVFIWIISPLFRLIDPIPNFIHDWLGEPALYHYIDECRKNNDIYLFGTLSEKARRKISKEVFTADGKYPKIIQRYHIQFYHKDAIDAFVEIVSGDFGFSQHGSFYIGAIDRIEINKQRTLYNVEAVFIPFTCY